MSRKVNEPVITRDMIEYDLYEENAISVVTLTDGSRYKIEFEDDYDSSPLDADCYSEADIEDWRNDKWRYVGVIVTPDDVPESVQFELSDSLWGLEFDFPLDPPQEHNGRTFRYTDEDYLIMHYPVPDMITNVQASVFRWRLMEAVNSYVLS